MDLNKVFILGRVTADPQLRTTPSGQHVTSFGVATNRWAGKDKPQETEFHNVVAWGRQAEVATQFLQKGAMVLIEGRMRTRSWQDKQNQPRKTTEIICEKLQLGPRAAGAGPAVNGKMAAAGAEREAPAQAAPEDIPIIDLEEDVKVEDLPF
jgi:single-strand DNA-binding protein